MAIRVTLEDLKVYLSTEITKSFPTKNDGKWTTLKSQQDNIWHNREF